MFSPLVSHCHDAHRRKPLLALLAMLTLAGCQASPALYTAAPEQLQAAPVTDFSRYRAGVKTHLEQYRVAIDGFSRAEQVAWNLPFRRSPATNCTGPGEPRRGILLVHGLSDSPFVFRDLAGALAERCLTVHTLLLQGHGTRPGDLIEARAEVWREQVRQHFAALAAAVDQAFIGGFSLGGALATEFALDPETPTPAGLLALAPAWELNGLREYLWLAPYADLVADFVEEEPERNPVKYESLALNAATQLARVRADTQARLTSPSRRDLPLMLVATEADSVINLDFLVRQFQQRFENPANRMLVFRDLRNPAPELQQDDRILSLDSYLPQQRILEFSHMALAIAPDNLLYGREGELHRCLEPNSLTLAQCRALAPDELWFSAWHEEDPGVPTSRLTFNPHFARMVAEIGQFLDRAVVAADAKP